MGYLQGNNDHVPDKVSFILSEGGADFFEDMASNIDGEWYYMPFWWRKVKPGVYERWSFEHLPESLKSRILAIRDGTATNNSK